LRKPCYLGVIPPCAVVVHLHIFVPFAGGVGVAVGDAGFAYGRGGACECEITERIVVVSVSHISRLVSYRHNTPKVIRMIIKLLPANRHRHKRIQPIHHIRRLQDIIPIVGQYFYIF